MKTKNRIIIAALLIIVIASVIGFEITCNSDAKNIYIGIFSSSIVVLLLEIIAFFRDRYKYSFLDGIYQRQIITDKQILPINDSIYKDMTQSYKDDNVPDKIKLVYSGDGEYKGTAEYNEGKVEIVINLNADNRNVGTGTYQFTSKKPGYKMPDLGVYKIQVDQANENIIYVYYSNTIPSGIASGYEIWERK